MTRSVLWHTITPPLLFFVLLVGLQSCSASSIEWWKAPEGPAYQVLVYSFADSDGDGWGDLRGLTDRLDYLNDSKSGTSPSDQSLGITALWLSPVHSSASYHGYDVIDYTSIHPRLGTIDDFDRLIKEAHARGIRVIMDMVFNHTSSMHPWFLEWKRNPEGPYKDFYVTRDPGTTYGQGGMGTFHTTGNGTDFFAAFWDGMPDLNLANPQVTNELKGILDFWLARGVDGFRFDAVRHGFDTNEVAMGQGTLALNKAFWGDLVHYIKSRKPDTFTIGEVLTDSIPEVAAWVGVFDSLFDFPLAKTLLEEGASTQPASVVTAWTNNTRAYARKSPWYPSLLLSNHDQDRVMSYLQERTRGDRTEALARARMLASVLHTLPGLPWIYYGEELAMEGRRWQNDDISRRLGLRWSGDLTVPPQARWMESYDKTEPDMFRHVVPVTAQAFDPASLLSHYRALGRLRRDHPTLRNGVLGPPPEDFSLPEGVMAWTIASHDGTLLAVHNWADTSQDFDPGLAWTRVWADHAAKDAAAGTLAARSSVLWQRTGGGK